MKKITSVLPLAFSLSLCLITIMGTLFSGAAQITANFDGSDFSAGAFPLKNSTAVKPFAPTVEPPKTETQTQTEATVPVLADPSDAIGKIYEQFLSPYGQKLNYGGVYIKNSSGLSVDIKAELETALSFKMNKTSEPEVLIVHTHSTESYMSEDRDFYTAADTPRNDDDNKNVVLVGEKLASVLSEGGITVLHDKTHHDSPSYNQSYSRAKTTITEYLKKYPSIKVVVDIHRDSIAMDGSAKCKPTREINGKKAAQVMLVVGSQSGSVTDFPNWKQNFRLALRFQQTMEAMYPGLARAMLLCSRKYNTNLTNGSLLLEIGTDSNTLEEAVYSAELAGNALLGVLNTLK